MNAELEKFLKDRVHSAFGNGILYTPEDIVRALFAEIEKEAGLAAIETTGDPDPDDSDYALAIRKLKRRFGMEG